MTIADLDDICVTNTNRQIHALQDTIGLSKVSVMAGRLQEINPDIVVHAVEVYVLPEHVQALIPNDGRLVIDACDTIPAKAAIIGHCKRNKITIITIGGAGGQTDPRQVTTGDLAKTIQCPLSAKLRSELRRNYHLSKNPKRRFGVSVLSTGSNATARRQCVQQNQCKKAVPSGCASGWHKCCGHCDFGFVAVSRILKNC